MSARCGQELCPNWSGEGDVCPCTMLELERPCLHATFEVALTPEPVAS